MKLFGIQEINLIETKDSFNKIVYKIEGEGYEKTEEIELQRKQAGRFILATNLVDDDKLKPEEVIKNYKNQQSCERGFRFLKDSRWNLKIMGRLFVKDAGWLTS